MSFNGTADMQATTTEELRKLEQGVYNWYNATVTLKVLTKTLSQPKVGQRGEFRTLFVTLCNDDELRVRLVAWSPAAETLFAQFEESALVRFSGLEVSEAYCKEGQKPVGPLSIEFRGVADSAAEQLMSNYKVQRGMPFTHVKDIDFSKVHMRYKVSAELTSDFTPYQRGLTGQAVLRDSTGRLPVHVLISNAAFGSEKLFRNGKQVTFKGTFHKLSMVTRLTVEGEGDVDFVPPSKPSLFGTAASSGLVPQSPSSSTALMSRPQLASKVVDVSLLSESFTLSSDRFPSSTRRSSNASSSLSSITGVIVEDFTEVEDHLWGMVKVDEDSFYEVNMNNMPESSVGLFCQGAPVTLSGIIDGFAMSVDRWCDVSIEGHELFGAGEVGKDDQQLRASDALELRQTTELTLRRATAKLVTSKAGLEQMVLTCIVRDAAMVILKVTLSKEAAVLSELYAGCVLSATGLAVFNGTYCEMFVADDSHVAVLSDGTADGVSSSSNSVGAVAMGQVAPKVKEEPVDNPSRFGACFGGKPLTAGTNANGVPLCGQSSAANSVKTGETLTTVKADEDIQFVGEHNALSDGQALARPKMTPRKPKTPKTAKTLKTPKGSAKWKMGSDSVPQVPFGTETSTNEAAVNGATNKATTKRKEPTSVVPAASLAATRPKRESTKVPKLDLGSGSGSAPNPYPNDPLAHNFHDSDDDTLDLNAGPEKVGQQEVIFDDGTAESGQEPSDP